MKNVLQFNLKVDVELHSETQQSMSMKSGAFPGMLVHVLNWDCCNEDSYETESFNN